jgi:hypothetical protein
MGSRCFYIENQRFYECPPPQGLSEARRGIQRLQKSPVPEKCRDNSRVGIIIMRLGRVRRKREEMESVKKKGVKGLLPLGCFPLWGREGVTLIQS